MSRKPYKTLAVEHQDRLFRGQIYQTSTDPKGRRYKSTERATGTVLRQAWLTPDGREIPSAERGRAVQLAKKWQYATIDVTDLAAPEAPPEVWSVEAVIDASTIPIAAWEGTLYQWLPEGEHQATYLRGALELSGSVLVIRGSFSRGRPRLYGVRADGGHLYVQRLRTHEHVYQPLPEQQDTDWEASRMQSLLADLDTLRTEYQEWTHEEDSTRDELIEEAIAAAKARIGGAV